MKLGNPFLRLYAGLFPGTCLVLLLLCQAGPLSAQTNPLSRLKSDSLVPQNETGDFRVNTPRILPNRTNFRINTTSENVFAASPDSEWRTVPESNPANWNAAPSSNAVTSNAVPSGPMQINPLSATNDETTQQAPLTLRRNDTSTVEPVVPIGSYYRSEFDRNMQPTTPESVNPVEARPTTLQESGAMSPTAATALEPQVNPSESAQIEKIIQQGAILEKEGRWNEALALYENAIRTFHKPPVLMERFRFARFHHDLTRRYNDSSFDMLLRQMAYQDALALFDEVVAKIQLSHVDPPHWNELFENGMHDFEIALADPAFCRRHLPNVDTTRVRSLSRKVVQTTQNWEIRDPRTLRSGVTAIADNCQKEIGLSPTAVVLEFLSGMTNSLDPYTEFMTLNQFNDTNCMISGNFVGLGVELKMDRKSLYVNRVIPGSPAERGGLQNLDRILVVDGTSTEGLPLETASNLLQGEADSTVRLLVQSGATAPRETIIRREHLKVPSVENVHILSEYGQGMGIGYFKLTGFQRDTVREIHEALLLLYRQGMKSLIIDLRGNAGGVLTESIGAADLFLKQGVIVRTKNRGPVPEYVYSATQKSYTWDMPLAVLIDKDSASASEIFAGAILDNNRGLVVGQPSFGKDTVQAVIPLTGGKPQNTPAIAGLKLTTETYYSPNGISFSGIGVQPNILASNGVAHSVSRPNDELVNINAGQPVLPDDRVLQTAIDEIFRQSRLSQTAAPGQTLSTRYQPSVN